MPSPAIFTIGYGVRSPEVFVSLLKDTGISYLVDVRTKPYSKFNPVFNKEGLEGFLFRYGVRYIYMGDVLGGRPHDSSMVVGGRFSYELMAKTKEFQSGVDRLEKAYKLGVAVCLMCSECKPEECHRSKLIGEDLVKRGVPVTHIDENGFRVSHHELIAKITGGQLDIFGNQFTSKRSYGSSFTG